MWLLRAKRERKDGREDGTSKMRGEEIKGCREKKEGRESEAVGANGGEGKN